MSGWVGQSKHGLREIEPRYLSLSGSSGNLIKCQKLGSLVGGLFGGSVSSNPKKNTSPAATLLCSAAAFCFRSRQARHSEWLEWTCSARFLPTVFPQVGAGSNVKHAQRTTLTVGPGLFRRVACKVLERSFLFATHAPRCVVPLRA